jgi:flagellar biosynthesis anti-sigma factor FlgM
MRIESAPASEALLGSQRSVKPAAANASGSSAGNSAVAGRASALGEDQAQLSTAGVQVQLQALVAQVAQLPESGQSKLTALRQAVLSGSYEASPQKIAGALFENLVTNRAA